MSGAVYATLRWSVVRSAGKLLMLAVHLAQKRFTQLREML